MRYGRHLFAVVFIFAGLNHFLQPGFHRSIVPPYLPAPGFLVAASGAAAIILGSLLLSEKTRRIAAWGLIGYLVTVFPANIHMALHPELFPKFPPILLWIRLPIQGLLIAWAYAYTRR